MVSIRKKFAAQRVFELMKIAMENSFLNKSAIWSVNGNEHADSD